MACTPCTPGSPKVYTWSGGRTTTIKCTKCNRQISQTTEYPTRYSK